MQLINDILRTAAIKVKASDVHLNVPACRRCSASTPSSRLRRTLPINDAATLEAIAKFLMPDPDRYAGFLKLRDADFSYSLPGVARFRVNAHYQRGAIAFSLRAINDKVRPLTDLYLPDIVHKLTHTPRGLILVTGPTGSGKSTTLAGMIDAINAREQVAHHHTRRPDRIRLRQQQERHRAARSRGRTSPALPAACGTCCARIPDTILVGEMRDLETVSAAISAAETGHLVFSTLHTVNAPLTIERIIDVYPSDQQNQIRSMLANTLAAVISQTLFKRKDRPAMIPGGRRS